MLITVAAMATPASAQTEPGITLSVDREQAIGLGPDDAPVQVNLTVRNTGPTQGTVALGATAPRGWVAQLSESSFTLASQAPRTVRVTIQLASGTGEPTAEGNVDITGTITDTLGRTATASETVPVRYLAPPPPAEPPPPPPNYVPAISASIGGGLVVVLAGAYVLQARGVSIRVADSRRRINTGTEGVFLVDVGNRSRRAVTAQLRIDGLPRTWAAAFSFPAVRLDARETVQVPLLVKVPLGTPAGTEAPLRVYARPNRFSPWLVRGDMTVSVLDVGPAGGIAPVAGPTAS